MNVIGEEERLEASAFVASGVRDPVTTVTDAPVCPFQGPVRDGQIDLRWWLAALVAGALMWTLLLSLLT